MKAVKLFILGAALLFATNLEAQISVSLNISSPPLWGPVGYADVRYYYLPDIESYYDVNSSMFIYLNAGNWVHRKSLPVVRAEMGRTRKNKTSIRILEVWDSGTKCVELI